MIGIALMQKGERMADLIDRDEAIKRIDRQRVVDKSVVKRLLYTMPTTKSEIITCKDCSHAEYDTMFRVYWCTRREDEEVFPDHYCGYAERKETTE